LWKLVRRQAGIDRSAFAAYFAGCDIAYAIEVLSPQRLQPAPLRFAGSLDALGGGAGGV
jgi:predicted transcriptional regulator